MHRKKRSVLFGVLTTGAGVLCFLSFQNCGHSSAGTSSGADSGSASVSQSDGSTNPGITPSPVPANVNPAAGEAYSLSYEAGGTDAQGHFLGGTELMSLVAFQGKLYGGLGYWEDDPNPAFPHPGAQVMVLDSKDSKWREETHFNDGMNRVGVMGVVTFHTDKNGHALNPPVQMLIAGTDSVIAGGSAGAKSGAVHVQISPGVWKDANYPATEPLRSMSMFVDPVSGAEKLYVGAAYDSSVGAVYAAVYDPTNPNAVAGLNWTTTPAVTGFNNRVMAITECNGKMFFSAKPSVYTLNGAAAAPATFFTETGADASPAPLANGGLTWGFRGLTCTQDTGSPSLLGAFEGASGNIVRVDAATGQNAVELVAHDFLTTVWGSPPATPTGNGVSKDLIIAYNDMPSVTYNGATYHIIGSNAHFPDPGARINSTWFMSRKDGGGASAYQVHEVPALPFTASYGRKDVNAPEARLYAIRTMVVSPFASDQGQVIYLGGYDAHVELGVHNTAWAYRVGVNVALKPFAK